MAFGVEPAVVSEQGAGHLRVVEVGRKRSACVEAADGLALFVGELEVVESEVARHAFGPFRLRDDADAFVRQEFRHT